MNKLTFTQKVTRQRRVNKAKVTRRKEIKIRAEINEIDTKKTMKKIKLRAVFLKR